jgi:hypothetical protein
MWCGKKDGGADHMRRKARRPGVRQLNVLSIDTWSWAGSSSLLAFPLLPDSGTQKFDEREKNRGGKKVK